MLCTAFLREHDIDRRVVDEQRRDRGTGRMPERKVERVEVVARRLYLPPVDDPVAETEEDVLHLASDLRDRVQVAPAAASCRKRDVDLLGGQPSIEIGPRQLGFPRVDGCLEPLPHCVEGHPGLAVANLA